MVTLIKQLQYKTRKIIIKVWWTIYETEKWWCVVKMVFLGDNIS